MVTTRAGTTAQSTTSPACRHDATGTVPLMATGIRLRHLRRYGEIGRLLVKYGRSDLARQLQLDDVPAPHPETEAPPEAVELADDLERLGPTFIKLGQLLSTRTDMFPPAYTEALARLQDDVEPMPVAEVHAVFEQELGLRTD